MKRYLCFTAVFAVILLAGCAKENFESPKDVFTVTIGATAQENTKTSIGTKEDDSYPVIWSTGDKIAVNGTASGEAQIQSDPSYAKFTVSGVETASKYTLIYPYTEGNGAQEVTFEGTALPMWAETETLDESTNVSFQPLYGVLKFSVKGTASISSIILSTQDGSQVTGKFAVGEEGVLTGKDATKTSLTVNYSPAIELNATEAHDFFIPVPAGTYNIFDIQLVDSDSGSMTKKIGGDGNYEIGAGKVKEFSAFTYATNSHLFVIKSSADLDRFAELVRSNSFSSSWGGVKVVSDTIIASSSWEPLDFNGKFDGGNDTIILTKPLFGTLTDAEVKNLVVEGNNMTNSGTDAATSFGALANTTAGTTVIDNCKVCGDVKLDLSENTSTSSFNFAGLVGNLASGKITESNSTASVHVAAVGETKRTINVGAIAGVIADGTEVKDCSISGMYVRTDDQTGASTSFNIGGIVGYALTGSTITGCHTDEGCYNNTAVSIRMHVYTYTAGGIVGRCEAVTVKDCYSTQDVAASRKKEEVSYAYLGGILGVGKGVTVSNCENSGVVSLGNASTVAKTMQVRMGGIAGFVEGASTLVDVTNSGTIRYYSDASLATVFTVGGILGYSGLSININNWKNSGEIRIAPTAPAKGSSGSYNVAVGGLLGWQTAKVSNVATTITTTGTAWNDGPINVVDSLAPRTAATSTKNDYAYVGGCVGAFRGTAGEWKFKNTGNISIVPEECEPVIPYVCAGGIFGHTAASSKAHAKFYGCDVFCTIINSEFNTGLICGWAYSNKEVKNCRLGGTVNDTELNSTYFESMNFTDGSGTVEGNTYWNGEE